MKWIMHKKIIYVNSIESDNNLYKNRVFTDYFKF